MSYWSKSLEEVFKELNSSNNGLCEEEVNTRLKQYGLNDIPKRRDLSALNLLASQLKAHALHTIRNPSDIPYPKKEEVLSKQTKYNISNNVNYLWCLTVLLPYSPIGAFLGFRPLNFQGLLVIFRILATYFSVVELIKNFFNKKYSSGKSVH